MADDLKDKMDPEISDASEAVEEIVKEEAAVVEPAEKKAKDAGKAAAAAAVTASAAKEAAKEAAKAAESLKASILYKPKTIAEFTEKSNIALQKSGLSDKIADFEKKYPEIAEQAKKALKSINLKNNK